MSGPRPALFIAHPLPRRAPARRARAPVASRRRPTWRDVVNADPPTRLVVGGLCVPRHRWQRRLRQRGVYRSVEYVVESLELDGACVGSTDAVSAARRHEVEAVLRPAVGLEARFERAWPVRAAVGDARLWSYKRDVLTCAGVCVALSAALIGGALALRALCGVYAIPSASMQPVLRRGDAVLVVRVSPRRQPVSRGEIVFFRPPRAVRDAVAAAGGALRARDLLVKRVAAVAGDDVVVDAQGVRVNGACVAGPPPSGTALQVRADAFRVPDGFVFLLGDNGQASIDSRYWGVLPEAEIVGRPVLRVFPPDRISVRL